MGKLTSKQVDNLTKPGRYRDGDGLYFDVRKPDKGARFVKAGQEAQREPARSWIFRYTRHDKAHAMGLGPFPDVGLSKARRLAFLARETLRDGKDTSY